MKVIRESLLFAKDFVYLAVVFVLVCVQEVEAADEDCGEHYLCDDGCEYSVATIFRCAEDAYHRGEHYESDDEKFHSGMLFIS
jgi:hypothetical protein